MPRDASSLDKLLESPRIWRARNQAPAERGLSSGYKQFDRHLPGGGWPRAALTEILVEQYGIGELRLLMPALASLCVEEPGAGLDCLGGAATATLSAGIAAPGHRSFPPADRASPKRQRNSLVGRTGLVVGHLRRCAAVAENTRRPGQPAFTACCRKRRELGDRIPAACRSP